MTDNKVVRSICYFTDTLDHQIKERIDELAERLEMQGFAIQTKRICSKQKSIARIDAAFKEGGLYLSVGTLERDSAHDQLAHFLKAGNVSFNLNLSGCVEPQDADLVFKIIRQEPEKTFSFTYTFHNPPSSPYFPSATYHENGFSIGLQPTDLSEGCHTLDAWLMNMKSVWHEIAALFEEAPDFIGIDSSVAPLFTGKSSFIHFIKALYGSFAMSVTKDVYLRVTEFIKHENPKPVGLCGVMFPCLEDFELAEEYEKGRFPIERNVFLSLHSGLGIDTYPIGIDESRERVFETLCLIRALSAKYEKALSARFVSDGKAKIGEKTGFQNQYLKNVTIRPL